MNLVIPLRPANLSDLQNQVKRVRNIPFFALEVALDNLKEIQVKDLNATLKGFKKPVIVVCKGKEEKGGFRGTEQERIDLLIRGIEAGAQYVDIGMHTSSLLLKKLKIAAKKKKTKLIISKHFWKDTPSLDVLLRLASEGFSLGADIVKLAAYSKNWSDIVTLFELTTRFANAKKKIITIGMGEKGKISRVMLPLLGSQWSYAALDEDLKTAPGQMTIKDMRNWENTLS